MSGKRQAHEITDNRKHIQMFILMCYYVMFNTSKLISIFYTLEKRCI